MKGTDSIFAFPDLRHLWRITASRPATLHDTCLGKTIVQCMDVEAPSEKEARAKIPRPWEVESCVSKEQLAAERLMRSLSYR